MTTLPPPSLYERIGGRDGLMLLLRRFYADVRQHHVIGPIFTARIDDWPSHLEKIAGFWSGLMDWINGQLVGDRMIGVDDPKLIRVIDDPQQVVDAIFDHYHSRGFEPSPAEREAELAL